MKKILSLVIFILTIQSTLYAQCSLTSNTNASTLTCGTAPLTGCGGIVYVGDGVTPMTLSMNANLNLTCLGAIRFIIRNNATLDFSSGNFDLNLASGSSIEFETGAILLPSNTGVAGCSASDRIKIGGEIIASCNGGAGALYDFPGLVTSGGFSPFTSVASPSSGCSPLASSITATASALPTGVTVSSFKWYTVSTGGSAVFTDTTSPYIYALTGLTSTTTYYVEMVTSSYTTVRKPVTITVNANNTGGAASSSPSVCISTAIPTITHVTTGATGIGAATGLPTGVTASWASNTISITGTPSVAGTFNYSIPLTGGCGSVSATGTITVNANNTAGAASSNPSVCIGTAIPTITHATTGATGIGAATGLPTGVTASWASNTISITGTPSVAGTFNYSIPLTGGCGSVSAIGTITVNANNTVGAASSSPSVCINTAIPTITHVTTGATGIGAATGLPTGVTASWASNIISITGTPSVAGTFNYSIPLTGGCGSVSATGTITVNANNTVGAASSSPSVCINTAIPTITHVTTGATGIGATTGLPTGVTASWASNSISINGTPSVAGTFNYSIPLTGGCGSVSATGTITVNANNTAGAASSSPSVCINTAIPTITHATTGATSIGAATGLPTGVTASWASNTISITGTPSVAGTFNYSIPLTGGCGSVSATGTITVNSLPATPTIGAITQPSCVNATGSVVLTGLPSSGTWTINPGAISGTGTSTTLTGLNPNTYNFTVTNANGCVSLPTSNVVLNSVLTNTWNGSVWSLGTPPAITQSVVIAGNYNTNLGNFSSCSLQINPGVTITVNSNQYIEVDNGIVNNGTLFVDDDGSLIQNNNASVNSGIGTNTMLRKPTNLHLFDYVYWASPLVTTPFSMIPNSRYYEWVPDFANPVGYGYGNWVTPSGSNMTVGKGYIFRVPSNLNQDVTFTGGQFNNGVVTATIKKGPYTGVFLPPPGINGPITIYDDNYNLIGNPYPSAIDAIQFVTDNSAVLEDGSVSLWRHLTSISNSNSSPYYQSFSYNYSANDYVIYNALGSNPPGAFDGKIASGQGFFIVMKDNSSVPSSSSVVFNNGQRSKTYDNSQFYKSTRDNKVSVPEKHRIWLDLVDSFKMATGQLIGYIDGATSGVDFLYDSKESLAEGFKFYSISGNDIFNIQGKGLPFNNDDQVKLGLIVPKDGNYTIAINAVDGRFLQNENKIYLEDKKMGIIHDLKLAPYTFTINKGNTVDRFVLRYTNNKLDIATGNKVSNVLKVLRDQNTIELVSEQLGIKKVLVYNLLGQSVYKNEKVEAKNCKIQTSDLQDQMLIIKGEYEDGTSFVRKIER